jgi:hypothetical protein
MLRLRDSMLRREMSIEMRRRRYMKEMDGVDEDMVREITVFGIHDTRWAGIMRRMEIADGCTSIYFLVFTGKS